MKGSQMGLSAGLAARPGGGLGVPTDLAAERLHLRPGPWSSLEPEGGQEDPEQPREVCQQEGDLQEG